MSKYLIFQNESIRFGYFAFKKTKGGGNKNELVLFYFIFGSDWLKQKRFYFLAIVLKLK
jgi:hypothetical protein